MLEENRSLKRYLEDVRTALTDARTAPSEIDQTLSMLKEQIDESLSNGVSVAEIIKSMDDPDSYRLQPEQSSTSRPILGLVGLVMGLCFFLLGMVVIPAISESLRLTTGNPLILVGMMILLTFGYFDRKSNVGRVSLTLGALIAIFVVATSLLQAI